MVDSVTALGGGATSGGTTSGLGSLDSDVFLQLMVAQLRYQNPMEPTDATAMMQQTAQFTTVETLQAIAESQRQIINMSQLNTAMDMVGKHVEAIDAVGSRTEGEVQGIKFTIDGVVLELDHVDVRLTDVLSVNVLDGGSATSPAAPDSGSAAAPAPTEASVGVDQFVAPTPDGASAQPGRIEQALVGEGPATTGGAASEPS